MPEQNSNTDGWTSDKPTGPGWWWYRDEYYSTAPVCLDWIGLIQRPAEMTLQVDMCTGEDQDLLGSLVSEMEGEWHLLEDVE